MRCRTSGAYGGGEEACSGDDDEDPHQCEADEFEERGGAGCSDDGVDGDLAAKCIANGSAIGVRSKASTTGRASLLTSRHGSRVISRPPLE